MAAVHRRTFEHATRVVGGVTQLAARLRVPFEDIESWMAGHAQPPLEAFFAAVDIVSEDTVSKLSQLYGPQGSAR